MSGQQGKWREDQVLVICPGSQTTLAQLGVGELTPPAQRIPTRMFKDPETDEFAPHHLHKRKKASAESEDDVEYVEDRDSTEGAIYPIQGGRIVNMPAFLAFLEHVHSLLTTTYHNTPIVIMTSPQWSNAQHEIITRYIFEKTKTPALCLIHSAVAAQFGGKWPNLTVVDIGFEKIDVTCLYEYVIVNQRSLGNPQPGFVPESGGNYFTKKLHELLSPKDFTYEMCEQLKKSTICEVLPYAPEFGHEMELPTEAAGSGPTSKSALPEPAKITEPIQPAPPIGDADKAGFEDKDGDEGVLDVANIVTSGNTREFLAKKEKEKAEKSKTKKGKGQEAEAAQAKPTRLPNNKRYTTNFQYEELIHEDVEVPIDNGEPKTDAVPAAVPVTAAAPEPAAAPAAAPAAPSSEDPAAAPAASDAPEPSTTANGDAQPEAAKESTEAGATATGEDKPAEAAGAAGGEANGETKEEPKDVTMEEAKPEPKEEPKEEPKAETTETPNGKASGETNGDALPFAAEVTETLTERRTRRARRDFEVSLERFTFAEPTTLRHIAQLIYSTVQGIPDLYKRQACWDSILFVGNGSRLRGLRENILQRLQADYLISPSSATIFTSELPSNMATPTGTGSQTPTGSYTGQLPTSSSVNPLLQAATTASLGVPGSIHAPGSNAGEAGPSHHAHGQTPTSIKMAPLPTYLAEWTKNGFEESMFLGSMICGRLAYTHQGNVDAATLEAYRGMSLSRVDYNDVGPKGIHTHNMFGGLV